PFFTLLYHILLVVIFLVALLVLFQSRKSRLTALVLGIPALAGRLTGFLLPGVWPGLASVLLNLLPALFLGYTVLTILRTIFADTEVSTDHINGAFCGYLLLGLAFGHLYCLVETFRPSSFHVGEHLGPLPAEGAGLHSLLSYFALITLTTVGYG